MTRTPAAAICLATSGALAGSSSSMRENLVKVPQPTSGNMRGARISLRAERRACAYDESALRSEAFTIVVVPCASLR